MSEPTYAELQYSLRKAYEQITSDKAVYEARIAELEAHNRRHQKAAVKHVAELQAMNHKLRETLKDLAQPLQQNFGPTVALVDEIVCKIANEGLTATPAASLDAVRKAEREAVAERLTSYPLQVRQWVPSSIETVGLTKDTVLCILGEAPAPEEK